MHRAVALAFTAQRLEQLPHDTPAADAFFSFPSYPHGLVSYMRYALEMSRAWVYTARRPSGSASNCLATSDMPNSSSIFSKLSPFVSGTKKYTKMPIRQSNAPNMKNMPCRMNQYSCSAVIDSVHTYIAFVPHCVLHREDGLRNKSAIGCTSYAFPRQLTPSHDEIEEPLRCSTHRHIRRAQPRRGYFADQDPTARAPAKLEESSSHHQRPCRPPPGWRGQNLRRPKIYASDGHVAERGHLKAQCQILQILCRRMKAR